MHAEGENVTCKILTDTLEKLTPPRVFHMFVYLPIKFFLRVMLTTLYRTFAYQRVAMYPTLTNMPFFLLSM